MFPNLKELNSQYCRGVHIDVIMRTLDQYSDNTYDSHGRTIAEHGIYIGMSDELLIPIIKKCGYNVLLRSYNMLMSDKVTDLLISITNYNDTNIYGNTLLIEMLSCNQIIHRSGYLLDKLINAWPTKAFSQKDSHGRTPLMLAIDNDNVSSNMLLKLIKKSDLDVTDKNGSTALIHMINNMTYRDRFIHTMIQESNLIIYDRNGMNALIHGIVNKIDTKLILSMINYNTARCIDNNTNNALIYALINGCDHIVIMKLIAYSDLRHKTYQGYTALSIAARVFADEHIIYTIMDNTKNVI